MAVKRSKEQGEKFEALRRVASRRRFFDETFEQWLRFLTNASDSTRFELADGRVVFGTLRSFTSESFTLEAGGVEETLHCSQMLSIPRICEYPDDERMPRQGKLF